MNDTAVFGGGCFWCTEAIFQSLKGVSSVLPGYAGGHIADPTYEQVCQGNTGHVEVTRVEFDPSVIKFTDLLNVFFATHNPTTLNRQGNDVGEQYKSVIFYLSEQQKNQAQEFVKQAQGEFGSPIVTEIKPLDKFYQAENYHQNYFKNNPNAPYCQVIIDPKVRKFRQKFQYLLK